MVRSREGSSISEHVRASRDSELDRVERLDQHVRCITIILFQLQPPDALTDVIILCLCCFLGSSNEATLVRCLSSKARQSASFPV